MFYEKWKLTFICFTEDTSQSETSPSNPVSSSNMELSNIVNNRMVESPVRNTRSSLKKRRNMKEDRSDKFFNSDMLELSKLGIYLSEEKSKSFESNMQSKKSTFLEVSSNISGTSQISTKDNRACSDNFVGNSCSPVTISLNDNSSVNLVSFTNRRKYVERNSFEPKSDRNIPILIYFCTLE